MFAKNGGSGARLYDLQEDLHINEDIVGSHQDILNNTGASLKVEFLQYPFTLTIGFLDSCRMLRSDNAQSREEQLRSGK